MQRRLQILVPGIFGGFLALTLWRTIVHGFMETPSFEAAHLDAGAGDFGLIVEFFMAVATFLLAAVWFFVERGRRAKVSAVVLALVTPALFAFSARGLQRFGADYS